MGCESVLVMRVALLERQAQAVAQVPMRETHVSLYPIYAQRTQTERPREVCAFGTALGNFIKAGQGSNGRSFLRVFGDDAGGDFVVGFVRKDATGKQLILGGVGAASDDAMDVGVG